MAQVGEGDQVGTAVVEAGLRGQPQPAQHGPVALAVEHVRRAELAVGDAQIVEVGNHRRQRGHSRGPLGRVGQRSGCPGVGAHELGVHGAPAVGRIDGADESHHTGMVEALEHLRLSLDVAGALGRHLLDRNQPVRGPADRHRRHGSLTALRPLVSQDAGRSGTMYIPTKYTKQLDNAIFGLRVLLGSLPGRCPAGSLGRWPVHRSWLSRPGSPAERAGLRPGDEVAAIAGEAPRDVIRWQLLSDGAEVRLEVERAGDRFAVVVNKREGEPLGAEVDAAVFDGVQTCDNHCEFCFVHQLPRGMRRSLYLKDDDYRLSFLYGNFTTLTRFTELDFERVVTERLSPLYVSIHSTDPDVRAAILQNRRGAVSLRWLRLLLDAGIEVHGQVVVCPGVNDGDVLDDTLAGVLDRFAELRTLCVVPLGLSRYNRQPRMRLHTRSEAGAVVDIVERWQSLFLQVLGRRLAFVADEYYLMCGRGFPAAEHYEGFEMHEDGIGMARSFETEFLKDGHQPTPPRSGFFAWVDGAPADGYRAPREGSAAEVVAPGPEASPVAVSLGPRRPRRDGAVAVLTGTLGAAVVSPLVASLGRRDARVLPVENRFFGGNIGVTGLMVGEDVARALDAEPEGDRYLLPDVCLSRGRFLDGMATQDLPREVEVVATHGRALRLALESP